MGDSVDFSIKKKTQIHITCHIRVYYKNVPNSNVV